MPTDHRNPLSFLPLTPFAFQVLLALADGERHGYAIIKEVEDRSGGTVRLRTGTLYTLLQRLLEQDLIVQPDAGLEPVPASSRAADKADSRRRYYRLTELGRRVAAAEAARLELQVRHARAARLLERRRG